MSAVMDQLEVEIVNRLQAIPFFANLTIVADPQKNIVEEITVKLGKLRTVIVPFVSTANDIRPGYSLSYFDEIQIDIGVFQNPLLKGNDPTPRAICEQIHAALKNWKPDSSESVVTARQPGISYSAKEGPLNIWNCAFSTKGGQLIELPKVATPGAVAAAGNVTLTCATAGAAIYYTTDGSQPAPRNGTLYAAPFASAGQTIKARAFLAGYLDSDRAQLNT